MITHVRFDGTTPSISRAALPSRIRARDLRVMLYTFSIGLDCAGLVGGFAVAKLARAEQWLTAGGFSLLALAIPLFLMFSIARETQCVETLENRALGISRALGALVGTAIFLMMLTFVIKLEDISRLGFAIAFGAAAAFIVLARVSLNVVFWKTMRGSATAKLLILDGIESSPEPTMDVLNVGADELWPDISRPEKIDALSWLVADYDRVIVACTEEHRRAWSLFLRGSDIGGEIILPNDILESAVAIGRCDGKDTLILSLGPLSLANRIQKRTFDLLLAIPLLVVLSPVMLATALAITLESKGPVMFRQVRVGQGNRQFRILKFRSMRDEATDLSGDLSARRDDARTTRVGAVIRRTSIDELPQLFNVLRGDMSLVGPRPHALGSLAGDALFWEVTERYWLRHALKPGITGLAQIQGFRGATEHRDDLTQRLRCDLEYLSDWSVWNDILILLKTIKVLAHKNAY